MKTIAIATNNSVVVQTIQDADFESLAPDAVFKLLGKSDSTVSHRYGNVAGVIVDFFPGLSDEAAETAYTAKSLSESVQANSDFKITPNDFLRFLGAVRRMAIRERAKAGDLVAEDMLDMFNRVAYIESTDADLKASLSYLETLESGAFTGISADFFANGSSFVS